MTITLVSHAIANGDTLTMPAHQAGDMLVAIIYRHSSTAGVTAPSGWLISRGNSGNTQRIQCHRKTAASSSETFGTWSGATQVAALVYRHTNYLILGGTSTANAATDVINYNVVLAASNTEQDQDRYYIGMSGYRANNTSGIAAPTNMTTIANVQGSSDGSLQVHDTDGLVSGWSSQSVTGSSLTVWTAMVIEVYDTRIPVSAAPPAALPTLRGGFSN